MSVWIRNLKRTLEDRPVVILHGNVRDKYIDSSGRVFENLTDLLAQLAREHSLSFCEVMRYDFVSGERPLPGQKAQPSKTRGGSSNGQAEDLSKDVTREIPPTRVLADWLDRLRATDTNRFAVINYLDKLVAYSTSYGDTEKEILLRFEKLIDNITPNHRLILVALTDTMVPVELYTHSPKTYVLPIPMPDKADRLAYLKHRLGGKTPHLDLLADISDGLSLQDLDRVAGAVSAATGRGQLGEPDLRRLVNKYRIGEQEDHWSALGIEKLRGAKHWFTEVEGVRGQDKAVAKVIDMLCLARTGLRGMASGTAAKPRGVLFFAGPTGVGKTLVAKKLAKFLFGSEEAFFRFDMSEFKEEHTDSKLIGSPPGYVGYEQGGRLTNAVRERPFCVILFDEIEKAHPKIMDAFLQILDDGRLTDSRGQTVFFTESVIIFTSNLGTRTTDSRGVSVDGEERGAIDRVLSDSSLSEEERKNRIREHFVRCVERFFAREISRPELLNRIGNNIVPFNYINAPDIQREIIRSILDRIKANFEDRYRAQQHQFSYDDAVVEQLVTKYSARIAEFGGRGITNAVEDEVMRTLAYAVLEAEERKARSVRFHVMVDSHTQRIMVRES